ncbi:peptidase C14, caspase catalytic [Tanacetum coccineum]
MMMLVNCSNCHTALQLPPGATSIRCAICQAITHLGDPRAAAPPPPGGYRPPGPSSIAPPHPSPGPLGPPPNVHGRKKAVIVGISYKFSRHELKGCLNDAKCMKFMLINKFRFPEASIILLTDVVSFFISSPYFDNIPEFYDHDLLEEERDPFKIPTKHNMRMALYWLVQGCQPGDSLVFHYSGHGSRQRNYNGDEVDGYDETLCPLDFETQGMIVDDEINTSIVKPLPVGVKLHAIIDACHSGTVLDLPFLCRMSRSGQYVWEDHRPRSGIWKGTNGGEVISISGCDDDQTSADTSALSKITSTGAMTFCFIQAIEHGNASTYGALLSSMRNAIRSAKSDMGAGGGAVTSLLSMLLTGGSLTGGLGGGGFSQQTIVANSTTKAEYVAAANCYGQVLWIQNQLLDYGYNFMNTKIFIDNESTIFIVKNTMFHSKTKHIEIRHHFIGDSYEKRLIQVIKIHTDHNVADLLTKAFDVIRFQYMIANVGEGKAKRTTEISQSSGPIPFVTYEKEWEDRMERATTTDSSLEAEQDSGSGPRFQDTIFGGAEAQIRFKAASKQSNDPPLSRVNTLRSGEESIKLKELIEFCTKLSVRALNL